MQRYTDWNKRNIIVVSVLFCVLTIIATHGMLSFRRAIVANEHENAHRVLLDSTTDQAAAFNALLAEMYMRLEQQASSAKTDAWLLEGGHIAVPESSDLTITGCVPANGAAQVHGGIDITSMEVFKSAKRGARSVGFLRKKNESDINRFLLAVPIRRNGQIAGVLWGAYPASLFRATITTSAYDGHSCAVLFDGNGRLLIEKAAKDANHKHGDNFFEEFESASYEDNYSLERLKRDMEGKMPSAFYYTIGNDRRCCAFHPLGVNNWHLFHFVPYEIVNAKAYETSLRVNAMIAAALLFAALFLTYVLLSARRQMKRAIKEKQEAQASEERLRIALENTSVTIWDYDFERRCIVQNSRSQEQHGFENIVPNVPESLVESGFVYPESASAFYEMYAKLRAGEKTASGIFKVQTNDRKGYWYEHIRYTNIFDDNGRPYRAIGMSEDVTVRYETQVNYQRELSLQKALSSGTLATVLIDLTTSETLRAQFRYPQHNGASEHTPFHEFMRIAEANVVENEEIKKFFRTLTPKHIIDRFNMGQDHISIEYERVISDGSIRWVRDEHRVLKDPENGHVMLFAHLIDIDDSVRERERLTAAAETDSMTGLLNHDATFSHITGYLRAQGSIGLHALIMVDLDNFKSINDTMGHQKGDEILKDTAATLRRCFRKSDIVGRVGGDEFLVLMKNAPSYSFIRRKAAEVVNMLQFSCTLGDKSASASASVGVSICASGNREFEHLYSEADTALYAAKTAGKGRYALSNSMYEAEGRESTDVANADSGGVVQLQPLLEYMDGGVFLVEAGDQTRIVYASPSAYTVFRRTGRDAGVNYKDFLSLVHPDDHELLASATRNATTQGSAEAVFRVYESNGEIGWRNIKATLLPGERAVPMFICVVSDITSVKETEKKLRLAEERYRVAMSQTRAVIWEVNLTTRELYHPEAEAFCGSTDGIIDNAPDGVLCIGMVHPDSEAEFRRMFDDLYAGVEGNSYNIRTKLKDGGYAWEKASFSILRDETGAPNYAVGVAEYVPNIGSEMDEFETELALYDTIAPFLIGHIRVNLTTNTGERVSMGGDERYSAFEDAQVPYDELRAVFSEAIANDEDRETLRRLLQGSVMVDKYNSGQRWLYIDYRRKYANGAIRWTSATVRLMRHPVSGDLYTFIYIRDTDARRRWELALPGRIDHDRATRLYTRESFASIIVHALSEQRNSDGLCALCLVEMGGLDIIEETKGSYVLDNVIIAVGRVMRILESVQVIGCRLDDKHIALFYAEADSEETMQLRVSEISDKVLGAMNSFGRVPDASVNVGIALEPCATAECGALMKKALIACSEAADRINRPVVVYAASHQIKDSEPVNQSADKALTEKPRDNDTDALTGALTRACYYNMLHMTSPDSISSVGAMFIDVNGLSQLNRERGVTYGDELLRFIAHTIATAFESTPGCNVYRLFDDEFVALCLNITEEKFLANCAEAASRFEKEHPDQLSYGMTWGSSVTSIQGFVDNAEELAKIRKGSHDWRTKQSPDQYTDEIRRRLEDDIADGRYMPYLQPKACVKTGAIVGAEALCRYLDHTGIIQSPKSFISALERERLIKTLDLHITRMTVDLLQEWKELGVRLLPVSVNFSRLTLLDPKTPEELEDIFAGREELKEYIEIEITETVGSIGLATITRICMQYMDAGYRLDLDDYGSDYSSLYILSALQFHAIKVDKSVIDTVVTNSRSRLIVDSTKHICRETGALMVAEGVESEAQLETLKSLDCDIAQGYYFNKPIEPGEFCEKYLR